MKKVFPKYNKKAGLICLLIAGLCFSLFVFSNAVSLAEAEEASDPASLWQVRDTVAEKDEEGLTFRSQNDVFAQFKGGFKLDSFCISSEPEIDADYNMTVSLLNQDGEIKMKTDLTYDAQNNSLRAVWTFGNSNNSSLTMSCSGNGGSIALRIYLAPMLDLMTGKESKAWYLGANNTGERQSLIGDAKLGAYLDQLNEEEITVRIEADMGLTLRQMTDEIYYEVPSYDLFFIDTAYVGYSKIEVRWSYPEDIEFNSARLESFSGGKRNFAYDYGKTIMSYKDTELNQGTEYTYRLTGYEQKISENNLCPKIVFRAVNVSVSTLKGQMTGFLLTVFGITAGLVAAVLIYIFWPRIIVFLKRRKLCKQ